MPKLPSLKPKEVIKRLKMLGFLEDRQKGSHVIMYNKSGKRAVIPLHVGDIPKGTLHAIIKQSGIDLKEFLKK